MGQHQFAFAARFPWHHRLLAGHHEFGQRDVGRHKMQIVLFSALAGKVAQKITDPVVGVHGPHAPGLIKARTKRRIIQTRLAAHKGFAKPQGFRLNIGKVFPQHVSQTRRVRGGTRDGINAELPDRADQKFGPARAKGHHHRPCFFKAKVICHSAHPQLVVEAVDYGIVRPESRRRLGPARDLGLQFGIMR